MNLNSFFQSIFQNNYIGIIITIIAILAISLLLIHIFYYIINKASKRLDMDITVSYLLKDLIKYIIYIIAFVIILEIVGIDVTGLIVSLGIIGISIGFAGRDVISNFISGIFILSDKTIKVGEFIEVEDVKGKVEKVGFRTTTLITPDNSIVTIPNSVLSSNPYMNHTYLKEHRIDMIISLPYNIDLNQFKESFTKKIEELDWVLKNTPPKIFIKELKNSGIELKISAWGTDYSKVEEYRLNLAEEARKIINKYINKNKEISAQ